MSDPREVLRRKLAERYAPIVAELALKVDKPNPEMTLADLRCDRAADIYLEKAMDFLLGPSRQSRINEVQAAQAHERALREDEDETVKRQARQDVIKHRSGRTH